MMRTPIFLFGFIPIRTIVLVLIAIFFGLVFTMVAWPSWWRRYFDKKKEAAKMKGQKQKSGISIFGLAAVLILVLLTGMVVGSIMGFRSAVNNLPTSCPNPNEGCYVIDCSDINISGSSCPGCECLFCGTSIDIKVPVNS